jgi:hypothetical protein
MYTYMYMCVLCKYIYVYVRVCVCVCVCMCVVSVFYGVNHSSEPVAHTYTHSQECTHLPTEDGTKGSTAAT